MGKGRIIAVGVIALALLGGVLSAFDDPDDTATTTSPSTIAATTTLPIYERISASAARVHRDHLGDAWPFIADEGVVRCQIHPDLGAVLTFEVDQVSYALNGVAATQGFLELDDDVWIEGSSTKPATDLARELC